MDCAAMDADDFGTACSAKHWITFAHNLKIIRQWIHYYHLHYYALPLFSGQ